MIDPVEHTLLDCNGGLYLPGHFESFLAWNFRLVDRFGVQLDVADYLVISLCPDHEAAVAVYLLGQFPSKAALR